jgi:hypothetical protein
MKTYATTSWTQRVAIIAATVVIGVGALETVAAAMTSPGADTIAVRQQVLAAQSARATQIREMKQGEVRVATTAGSRGR